jgi:hypothetical protein
MKRHVSCFLEKAGFEPRTLGTKAERYDHCATRPAINQTIDGALRLQAPHAAAAAPGVGVGGRRRGRRPARGSPPALPPCPAPPAAAAARRRDGALRLQAPPADPAAPGVGVGVGGRGGRLAARRRRSRPAPPRLHAPPRAAALAPCGCRRRQPPGQNGIDKGLLRRPSRISLF